MSSDTIRVFLADDQALVRSGFRMLIDSEDDLEVTGEAPNGADTVAALLTSPADVVLMDIRMPVVDGIVATREVLKLSPAAKVLVLTTFDADELVIDAIRAGAAGFLLKDSTPEQIVGAVKTVAKGEPIMSPAVLGELMNRAARAGDTGGDARRRLSNLTPREREVAEALADGLTNAEIATQLFLSLPTVKSHVSNILSKLGADNRVQAALVVHDARGR